MTPCPPSLLRFASRSRQERSWSAPEHFGRRIVRGTKSRVRTRRRFAGRPNGLFAARCSVLDRSRGREDVPSHPAPPVPTPGSSPPRCCRQIVTAVASPAQDRDVCADNITATSTLFCCVIFNLPLSNVAHVGAGSRPAAPGPFSPSPRGLGAVWPLPARRKKRKRSRMGGGGGKTRRDPSPRSRCRTADGECGGNRCHTLVSPQPDPRPHEGLDPFGGNKGAKPSPKRCRWGVLISL